MADQEFREPVSIVELVGEVGSSEMSVRRAGDQHGRAP